MSEEKLNGEQTNERRNRFKKVAEQRTNRILETLKLLGNCANKANYEYTEEEVKKIFIAIEKELKNTKSKFSEEDSKEEKFRL